jgi:hypothetical protein
MADLDWSHDGRLVGRISLGRDLVDRARLVLKGFTARIGNPPCGALRGGECEREWKPRLASISDALSKPISRCAKSS